jgi:hypothetical protein
MSRQAINNIAIYSSTRTAALSRFIRKYDLDVNKLEQDVLKLRNVRKDLTSAVSGYADNDFVQNLVNRYRLNEGIRAQEFFDTKFGRTVLNAIRKNGGEFNKEQVSDLLDNLNTNNDLKWARQIDMIAITVGLNINNYETYGHQLPDMLEAIEKLYLEYLSTLRKPIVTSKKEIMEMVENAAKKEEEINNQSPLKRLVINVPQFEYILNQVLNPLNQSVTLDEGVLDDTYTFEVYSGRMKKFLDFVNAIPTLKVTKLKKDGEYRYITVINTGRFEEWQPVVKFYQEHIKI